MTKEEIKTMTKEERKRQLEWSDPYEFGTVYAEYLLEENQQLKEQQKEFIDYLDAIISHLENDIKYYENNYTPTGKYLKATRINQYNCLLQMKAKYEEILSKIEKSDK